MLLKTENFINKKGFTLLELLVVISIITMLIGVLVPGMRGVTKHARKLKQKAYVRDIDVALELFREDHGYYPDSDVVNAVGVPAPNKVCGAQHLAEALVGRDDFGFDSRSQWHRAGEPAGTYDDDMDSLMKYRKRTYLELKQTGAYTINKLYPDLASTELMSGSIVSGTPNNGKNRAPVLTDLYDVRVSGLSDKSGTPIVYFKANTASRMHKEIPLASDDDNVTKTWIYDFADNEDIFMLPSIKDPTDTTIKHHFDPAYTDGVDDGKTLFYKTITNSRVNMLNPKPQNPHTFLLLSAGADGIFGTDDDINNF